MQRQDLDLKAAFPATAAAAGGGGYHYTFPASGIFSSLPAFPLPNFDEVASSSIANKLMIDALIAAQSLPPIPAPAISPATANLSSASLCSLPILAAVEPRFPLPQFSVESGQHLSPSGFGLQPQSFTNQQLSQIPYHAHQVPAAVPMLPLPRISVSTSAYSSVAQVSSSMAAAMGQTSINPPLLAVERALELPVGARPAASQANKALKRKSNSSVDVKTVVSESKKSNKKTKQESAAIPAAAAVGVKASGGKVNRKTKPELAAAAAAVAVAPTASGNKKNRKTKLIWSKEEFLAICAKHQDDEFLAKIAELSNVKTIGAQPAVINVKYPAPTNKNLCLRIAIGKFTFKEKPNRSDRHSWVFKEEEFLRIHGSAVQPYTSPNYFIKVSEASNASSYKVISQIWVSHTREFGEILDIKKGAFAAGADIMDINDTLLDAVFKPKYTYLWDSSRTNNKPENDPSQVKFRVFFAIADGKSWYKNFGFEPIDVVDVDSAWPTEHDDPIKLNQNVDKYHKAIKFMQNYSLSNFAKLLPQKFADAQEEKIKTLKELIKKYLKNDSDANSVDGFLKNLEKIIREEVKKADLKKVEGEVDKNAKVDLRQMLSVITDAQLDRVNIFNELVLKYSKPSHDEKSVDGTLETLAKAIKVAGKANSEARADSLRMFSLLGCPEKPTNEFEEHLKVLHNTVIFRRNRAAWESKRKGIALSDAAGGADYKGDVKLAAGGLQDSKSSSSSSSSSSASGLLDSKSKSSALSAAGGLQDSKSSSSSSSSSSSASGLLDSKSKSSALRASGVLHDSKSKSSASAVPPAAAFNILMPSPHTAIAAITYQAAIAACALQVPAGGAAVGDNKMQDTSSSSSLSLLGAAASARPIAVGLSLKKLSEIKACEDLLARIKDESPNKSALCLKQDANMKEKILKQYQNSGLAQKLFADINDVDDCYEEIFDSSDVTAAKKIELIAERDKMFDALVIEAVEWKIRELLGSMANAAVAGLSAAAAAANPANQLAASSSFDGQSFRFFAAPTAAAAAAASATNDIEMTNKNGI